MANFAKDVLKRSLDRYEARQADTGNISKIRWNGTVYALAAKLETAYFKKKIKAKSLAEAFRIGAALYEKKDGSPFNARSLRESLRGKQDRDAGNKK